MPLARLISRSLNPLFITFYYLIITLNLSTQVVTAIPVKAKWLLLGMVIITTYIIPALLITTFASYFQNLLKFTKKEGKIAVMFIAAVFYFLTFHLLNQIQLSPIFTLFILGSTTLIGICILITLVWNISIYMVAMGAFVGALLGITFIFDLNLLFYILLIIAFSGIVGFARLTQGLHRPAEVYAGFVLGTTVMLLHFLYI